MDEHGIEWDGKKFCFRIYYAIRKFPWDDGDPWVDLHKHFDDLDAPPFRIDGEVPGYYNDLVRLKAVSDIVGTIRHESVREALSAQVEKLSARVIVADAQMASESF